MSKKILLLICFVGISQAIFIDTNKNKETDGKEESKSWQVMKMYPRSHVQYKYESLAYPKYEFQYAVSDKKTGDHKQHRESRDGDRVRGEYSLVEPDGSVRKVEYNADGQYGFNAIVSKGVQKHGDHAFSVFDHARHFYPIGHNVKINHYFPNRENNIDSNVSDNVKEANPTSAQDEQEPRKDTVMVLLEAKDNIMLLKPLETTDLQNKDAEPANLNTEVTPVTISPTIGTIVVSDDENRNTEIENVPLKTAIQDNEDQVKDGHSDSEVASSYHSRMYYMY